MDGDSSETPTPQCTDSVSSGDGDSTAPASERSSPPSGHAAAESPPGHQTVKVIKVKVTNEPRSPNSHPAEPRSPPGPADDGKPMPGSPAEPESLSSPHDEPTSPPGPPAEPKSPSAPSADPKSPNGTTEDADGGSGAAEASSPDADGSPGGAAVPSERGSAASEPVKSDGETGPEDGRGSAEPPDDDDTGTEDDGDMDDASLSESSMDMDPDEADVAEAVEDAKKKIGDIMKKPKPRHTWSLVKELHKRQLGDRPSLIQHDKFRLRLCGSLHAVERLELMDKLCFHEGCVNCLNFNTSGDLLASGSDDLNVVVWDWQRQKKAYYYNSGHKSNIFEAKFLPLRHDTHIVSTSRDGQVRLAEISPAGECRSVRRLAQHRGSGRKLALLAHSPHTVLSCGEDAVVFSIDVRERHPTRLMTCVDSRKEVPTTYIASHPDDDNVFLLACNDRYVRVYDRRMIGAEERTFRRLCPHRLLDDSRGRYSVTCAVFNYNGSEILASYNDEDIFLFDAAHSDGADAVREYSGHRNNATIKGVNFFGPTSEYVMSGSDCGNIFIWEKQTEAIVQCMLGDDKGVVNCLEPHPFMPVLATSGLDDDVKLWIASRDQPPDFASLKETVERNLLERAEETPSGPALGDGIMWTLMQQVFSSWSRNPIHRAMVVDGSSDDSGGDDDDDGPGDCRPT